MIETLIGTNLQIRLWFRRPYYAMKHGSEKGPVEALWDVSLQIFLNWIDARPDKIFGGENMSQLWALVMISASRMVVKVFAFTWWVLIIIKMWGKTEGSLPSHGGLHPWLPWEKEAHYRSQAGPEPPATARGSWGLGPDNGREFESSYLMSSSRSDIKGGERHCQPNNGPCRSKEAMIGIGADQRLKSKTDI